MAGGKIFVSYRRGADSDAAARLAELLKKRYGADRVFFDVDSIPAGADFLVWLNDRLRDCGAFVPVIGPAWTKAIPRLQNDDDMVRLEIEAALARTDLPVLPLLVQGAKMPEAMDLPDSLHPFLHRNAIAAPHDQFTTVVEGSLAQALDDVVDHSRSNQNAPIAWIGMALFVAAVIALGTVALMSL